ncbi:MAG: hypothetical protein ACYTEG_09680 [Planctomycetota bacterium]
MHDNDRRRTSFGAVAEAYDRERARDPDELIETIVAHAGVGRALEIGCGTGIAAIQRRRVHTPARHLLRPQRRAGAESRTRAAQSNATTSPPSSAPAPNKLEPPDSPDGSNSMRSNDVSR